MFGAGAFESMLIYVGIAALGALVMRMAAQGLQRAYPCFWAYLIANWLQLLIPSILRIGTNAYSYAYVASEILILTLFVLVLLELYTKVFMGQRSIAFLSRHFILGALAASIVLSTVLLAFDRAPTGILQKFLIFERTITCSLMLFVMFNTAFLLYFPVQLARNVVYYSIGYAIYTLSKTASLLAHYQGLIPLPYYNGIVMTIANFCFVFWLFTLNRNGELQRVVAVHRSNAVEEAHALQQLRSINAAVGRIANDNR